MGVAGLAPAMIPHHMRLPVSFASKVRRRHKNLHMAFVSFSRGAGALPLPEREVSSHKMKTNEVALEQVVFIQK